ncbi:MAG: DHA2 family efflux MFS transporter permease subunit [Actinobacteria bacterium]|nr:DHA2 family efflux MFS transporter permease subunit [Actinomycetota bacterium]
MNRGTVLALVAMGLSVIILANDFTALNVALPSIEKAFDTDVSTAQWVINAYALVFGILIVTGGRLADLFGRKQAFFVGTTIFVAMSILGGAAQNEYWLIAARAAMGIGGALMFPAILGMTFAALPKEKAGIAGGLILGAAGIGQSIGPISGGLLTQYLSWRWTLFINLPIGLFAVIATWRAIHQPRERTNEEEGIDYGGILVLSVGLFALLFALDQGVDWGWGDWRILASLGFAAAFIVAFPFIEKRMGMGALIPPDVIRNRRFATACLTILLMSAAFIASMLYLPQFLEKILGYSPLRAGVAMLPIMLAFAALSFVAGPLYNRLGPKLIVSAGTVAIAVGALLLAFLRESSGYVALLPGMIVLGIGFGLFYSSATTAGITALDESRSSLAGGIAYMAQIGGGSIGLGVTTTIFTSLSERKLDAEVGSRLTDAQSDAAHGILAGTQSGNHVLHEYPGVGAELLRFVREAFVTGFNWAFRVDAALAFVGVAIALAFVGGTISRLGSARRT